MLENTLGQSEDQAIEIVNAKMFFFVFFSFTRYDTLFPELSSYEK